MSWILPSARQVLPVLRRLSGQSKDKHRPGYWREYHATNAEQRRPYLARKARQYRAARRAGRPREVDDAMLRVMREMDKEYTRSEIARRLGKHRNTVARYLETPGVPTGGRTVGMTGRRSA